MTRRRRRQHGNPFNIRGPLQVPDWSTVFGRSAPLALDIGFGVGGFVLELSRRHPEWNVLGLEIRERLVTDAQAAAKAAGLKNLHLMMANASTHLAQLVPERSLIFVAMSFPDPWFKRRHKKRGVLTEAWLDLLAGKMQPDATFHYMTDYEEGAHQALALLGSHWAFSGPEGGLAQTSTTGITSERELSHLKRGDPIYRLRFVRQPDQEAGTGEPAALQSIRRFVAALDAEDFATAATCLAAECRYASPAGPVLGRAQVVATYRANAVWGGRVLEQVAYESTLEPEADDRALVTFIDHLAHHGHQHEYRCQQRLVADRHGRIVSIEHLEDPAQKAALEAFFSRCGVTRLAAPLP